jgi:hypothetical protein
MNAATNRLPSFLMMAFFLMLMALLGGCGSGSSEDPVPTTPAELTLTPTDSTANVGQTITYVITGGVAPYSITPSNSAIATVSAVTASGSQSTFTATVHSLGTATLVLTDAAGTTVSSVLAVWPSGNDLFTSAPSAVIIAPGASATYSIGGGLAPYTAVSSNTSVATASISNGSTLFVGGVAVGDARIVVTDAMGAQVEINVTVASSSVAALATTAPSAVSLGVGGSGAQTYTISGGTPPYTVTSSNVRVATVSGPGSGTAFSVTGVSAGTATIQVRDATSTATVLISVNVADRTTGFVVTPTAADWTASCPAANATPVYSVFFINGGTPPYTVSSGSPLVGTVMSAIPSGPVTASNAPVTVGASGGYFVVAWPNAPSCSATGVVTFNVVDSTGAMPTAAPTFTIDTP